MNFHRVGLVSVDTKGTAPGEQQERVLSGPNCITVDDIQFVANQCV